MIVELIIIGALFIAILSLGLWCMKLKIDNDFYKCDLSDLKDYRELRKRPRICMMNRNNAWHVITGDFFNHALIASFPYDPSDTEDIEFAQREAEELAEIIVKTNLKDHNYDTRPTEPKLGVPAQGNKRNP